MYKYRVRPGYGSKNVLIEFMVNSENTDFVAILKEVFDQAEIVTTKKEDLWMNDEVLYHMVGECGEFQLSSDNWGSIFILANENQKAIGYLSNLLINSGAFIEEVVDAENYS